MTTLHIRCGSDIAGALSEAGVDGDFLEFGDPVCQGPAPAGLDDDAYRRLRARFIAEAWLDARAADALARLEREARALDGLDDYGRILLWFEHDLYDQSVLIDLLSRLRDRPGLHDRLHLLSIDRHPGIARFIGFGQLSPAQLAGLVGRETPVTPDMFERAVAAWAAFRADTPVALNGIIADGNEALPFLVPALRRHLQELPWRTDGLSLTERLSLRALADGAPTPGQAFGRLHGELEPQPHLGDLMYWAVLRRLADAATPAVTPFSGPRAPMALTDFGRRLLDGQADWVAENGVARWVGGIHLQGAAAWRWDPAIGQAVPGT